MKKRLLCCALVGTLVAGTVAGVGGDIADPLLSLGYLDTVVAPQVAQEVTQKLDAADAALLQGLDARLALAGSDVSVAPTWQEWQGNGEDTLLLPTGGNVQLLSGNVWIAFDSGAVVNVTTGAEIPSGSMLQPNQRYLVAEDTVARCIVTSKTAVLNHQGPYLLESGMGTDYVAMAESLKALSLFKGSFTGYGQGFDLELAPTRVQALMMFIRVLGEEGQALSYTGTTPFVDVAAGSLAEKYVGYAFEKGYTKGYSATTFCPDLPMPAVQYVEFLLRAMGHRDMNSTDLSTTFDVAASVDLVREAERAVMETSFLRADLVYTSYYALQTPTASGETLAQQLMAKGVFTEETFAAAQIAQQRQ